MKIVFTGGGTGGHIYPGLAIIEQLKQTHPNYEILWIGEKKGMEEQIVQEHAINFKGISAGKLRRYFSFKNFTDLFKIFMGFLQAIAIMAKEKPNLVFSKGGFVAVPSVWAAALFKIPIFIHESDYELGLANRLSASFASKIFVSFPHTIERSKEKWQKKMIYSGGPIRAEIKQGNRFAGRSQWLDGEHQQLILIMGGSQGAKAINDLIKNYLPIKLDNEVIIHQTGLLHEQYAHLKQPGYHPQAYFKEELADLIAAADLVVSRAGAGAINEFGAMQRSLLLLPLRGHQSDNARWLEEQKAVEVIYHDEASSANFNQKIKALLADSTQRKNLANKLKFLIKNDATEVLSQAIIAECEAKL